MALEAKIDGNTDIYDVLIIGGGPAAMSAAIYLANANKKVAFIEKGTPGGKIVNTFSIQNYPGTKEINGADLAIKMFEHCVSKKVEYLYGNVTNINQEQGYQVVYTEDGLTRYARALIIATGMKDRKLKIEGEEEYEYKGVSYCAVCDGIFARGKTAVIIGGGNSAIYNAIYLSDVVKKLYLVHRRNEYRAHETAIHTMEELKNVEIITNYNSSKIIGDGKKVTGLVIRSTKDNSEKTISTDSIFVYIGFDPATDFINENKILDDDGFIKVTGDMSTSIPGLFAAGDVIVKNVRQITTAVSDGTIAGLSAIQYIKQHWKNNTYE